MSTQLFRMKESSNRRLRMLAACDIKPGQRILAEEPYVTLPKLLSESDLPNVIEESKNLSKEQVDFVNSFSAIAGGKYGSTILSRIAHFLALSGTREGSMAMFKNISRTSHSCIPNACYSWNDDLGKQVLHAITLIPVDTIITVTFASPKEEFLRNRSAFLRPRYGFSCTCPICKGPAKIRERLSNLQRKYNAFHNGYFLRVQTGVPPAVLLREIDELILDVAKVDATDIEWGELANHAYNLCSMYGDIGCRREWALIAKGFWSHRRGLDSQDAMDAESVIQASESNAQSSISGSGGAIGPSSALKEYASRYRAFDEGDTESSGAGLSKVQKKNAARRAKAKEARVAITSSDNTQQ